jgi:hypothetical protein
MVSVHDERTDGSSGAVDDGAQDARLQVRHRRQGIGSAAGHAGHEELLRAQVICQLPQVICVIKADGVLT